MNRRSSIRRTQEQDKSEIVCELLNKALAIDPTAMQFLVEQRVMSSKWAESDIPITTGPDDEVGLVGIINGILVTLGCCKIAAGYSEECDTEVKGFVVLDEVNQAKLDAQRS